MKKLNITKTQYGQSKYFNTKYGSLKYMSESGDKYKTDKGFVLVLEDDNKKGSSEGGEGTGEEPGWMAKLAKAAWGKAKQKMVQIALAGTTGGVGAIPSIMDKILGVLDMIPGFDRKPYDEKLNSFSAMATEGAEGIEATIKNIPVVGDLLGSDVEALKNIIRYYVFSINVSSGSYSADDINIAKFAAAGAANGLAILTWALFIAGQVGGVVVEDKNGKKIKYNKEVITETGILNALGFLVKEFGTDISTTAFGWVSSDIETFEKWCKDKGKDLEGMTKAVQEGTAKVPPKKDGENKDSGNNGSNKGSDSTDEEGDNNGSSNGDSEEQDKKESDNNQSNGDDGNSSTNDSKNNEQSTDGDKDSQSSNNNNNNNNNGNDNMKKEQTIKWRPYNEGWVSGALKGIGKVAKSGMKKAGSAIAKGAKTAAKKAAPALKKAAKEVGKQVKDAAIDVGKDIAKDVAKDAAHGAVNMAKDAAAKLSDKALQKISEFSPETANFIKTTGQQALDYMADKGLTGDALMQYADKFIDNVGKNAEGNDKSTLDALKQQVDGAKGNDDAVMGILTQFVDAAKNSGGSENGDNNNQGDANASNDNAETAKNDNNAKQDSNTQTSANGGDAQASADNQSSGDSSAPEEQKQAAESTIKRMKVTKEKFNSSRYFQTKYGKLKYVSESGNLYKTTKGKIIMF